MASAMLMRSSAGSNPRTSWRMSCSMPASSSVVLMAATTPAIHRFPGSMAARLQELARIVEDTYGGDASRLWTEATDGKDLIKRVMALPGFGKQKAQIFVALLAKQAGVRPEGWEAVVGDYALEGHRSVADVVDAESLQKVRDFKKAKKAAGRAGAGA